MDFEKEVTQLKPDFFFVNTDGYTAAQKDAHINAASAAKLAAASEKCWQAICKRDVKAWGIAARESFEAQLEMFPAMLTPEMTQVIEEYKDQVCGWKISGCGGGGYLILIAEQELPNTIKGIPRS
jgi:galactokinase/mevalonate kinase-like predicted kinase